jgi:CheY-like chemotaxis protein
MYIGILLKRMGFNVFAIKKENVVLSMIREEKPDALFLDIMIAKNKEINFIKDLKRNKETSDIRVITVCSTSSREGTSGCKKIGGTICITKPVQLDNFHDALQQCIFAPMGFHRRHLRTLLNIKVKVNFDGKLDELYCDSLSEGGMFIRKQTPPPVGSKMKVYLPLGNKDFLKLSGSVIYVKGVWGDMFRISPGMAIEFNNLRDAELKKLRACVKEYLAGDLIKGQEEVVIT